METSSGRARVLWVCALALWMFAAQPLAAGEFGPNRVPAAQIPWPDASTRVEGTGMRSGLQVVFVAGDAKSSGLFTIMFKLPANTRIPPHSHPDMRSCFVLSGTFYFAYEHTTTFAADGSAGRQPLHRARGHEPLRRNTRRTGHCRVHGDGADWNDLRQPRRRSAQTVAL